MPRPSTFLEGYRFAGSITGYREGELYFPGSPILTVEGTFAEAVILETLALSVLNHDSAIATAAARMAIAAGDRPLAEMGSRRAGEHSAVAAARAAYIAGFGATCNLEAGRTWGIPTMGTAAHAWTLLHDTEEDAFRAQIDALGTETTLLVDTYDIARGVETAIRVAGTELGGVRIDSGDLPLVAAQVRAQLDELGATGTKITVTSDLDEFAIAALAASPVDAYGVGTSVVTGSGTPTAGMVYKLVARQGYRRRLGRRREGLDRQGVEGRPQGGVPHPRARHGDQRADRRVRRVRRARDGRDAPRRACAAGAARGGRRSGCRIPRSRRRPRGARPPCSRARGAARARARAQPVGSGDPDGLRRRGAARPSEPSKGQPISDS